MFWWIVAYIALIAISYALMPKPKSNIKPAGIDEFQVPTAQAGREVPVLFGTRELKGPNVVWYGHLRSVAIKKKSGK